MAVVCQGRSRVKSMRATGPDRLPCELLGTLPWANLRSLDGMFEIFLLTRQFPQDWGHILIAFMPKLPSLLSWTDARCLCLQNSLNR
eukprot:3040061-Pyramimonas_sp.AAC.1